MTDKLKAAWEYVQDLLDVKGDVLMLAFTSAMIFRVVYSAFGHPAMGTSEAAAYASAIAAFAYSNTGKPKQ